MEWIEILSDILAGISIICIVAAIVMSFLAYVPAVIVLFCTAVVCFSLSAHFESMYLKGKRKK